MQNLIGGLLTLTNQLCRQEAQHTLIVNIPLVAAAFSITVSDRFGNVLQGLEGNLGIPKFKKWQPRKVEDVTAPSQNNEGGQAIPLCSREQPPTSTHAQALPAWLTSGCIVWGAAGRQAISLRSREQPPNTLHGHAPPA